VSQTQFLAPSALVVLEIEHGQTLIPSAEAYLPIGHFSQVRVKVEL
jgi:hypothetical protein